MEKYSNLYSVGEMKKLILLVGCIFFFFNTLFSQSLQYKSKYPDIPIVDVHSHAGVEDYDNLIKVSETIKQKYGSNLAFWIGLSSTNPAKIKTVADRMFFAVAGPSGNFEVTPSIHNAYEGVGANDYVEEVIRKVNNEGYIGIKIHFGSYYRIENRGEIIIDRLDDPRFMNFFSRLEEENVLVTSLHIAEPNGPYDKRSTDRYLTRFTTNDPVYFWRQIRSFENILAKYPNLSIVAAHAAFLYAQDAQIDFLRYLLSTYPNLYIDIAAIYHMYYSIRDNIRDFFIEYQDRILFGSDFGTIHDNRIESNADLYANLFAILETTQVINFQFFGNRPIQGLDLSREVLEKIYYRNALKLYPGLREAMGL